jgi:hypothetical protein
MLKQDVQGSSNALYQFLKNKHLSKEIQKRIGEQPELRASGSKAYLDPKKDSAKKQRDTLSSKGSSSLSPNKFHRNSYHSSIKKNKSQSHLIHTQPPKELKSRSTSQNN